MTNEPYFREQSMLKYITYYRYETEREISIYMLCRDLLRVHTILTETGEALENIGKNNEYLPALAAWVETVTLRTEQEELRNDDDE